MSGENDDWQHVQTPDDYNELYRAVLGNDIKLVASILSIMTPCSIWDNDALKKDTVLICAAKKGNFEIFIKLLEQYDKDPKLLSGLRSSKSKLADGGTSLNYLLQHLEDDDCTINSEKYTLIQKCVNRYLESITKVQSMSVPFQQYTSVKDEYNKTPMDYLALNDGAPLLEAIKGIKASGFLGVFGKTYNITDIFNLRQSGEDGKTIMQLAADNGDAAFVETLYQISKDNPSKRAYTEVEYLQNIVRAKLGKSPALDELKKRTCDVFLQKLLDITPKDDKTVAAITLLEQLIYGDNYNITQPWLDSVENIMKKYSDFILYPIKSDTINDIFKCIKHDFANVINSELDIERAKYNIMLELRILVNIELEKIENQIANIVDRIKKLRTNNQVLNETDGIIIKAALHNGAKLPYGNEQNRDNASTNKLDAYKKALVETIKPNPGRISLRNLIIDIHNDKFLPDSAIENLVKLATEFNMQEDMSGSYLMLYGNLRSLNDSNLGDEANMLEEQFSNNIAYIKENITEDICEPFIIARKKFLTELNIRLAN